MQEQQILKVSRCLTVKLPDLSHIFHNREVSKAPAILERQLMTLHGEFELLPSDTL